MIIFSLSETFLDNAGRLARQRRFAALVIGLLLLLGAGSAEAVIRVQAEPGTDPAIVEDIQKTVAVYNQILQEDFNLTLERDVRILIAPTVESYAKVLWRDLGQSGDMAERTAKVSGGFSKGNAIALNCAAVVMKNAKGRARLTAHELFHQVQRQLMGDYYEKSLYGFREGSCDLVGARVAEKRGYQSMASWQLEVINTLRLATNPADPGDILHTDLNGWTRLMEDKRTPYQVADMMVLSLFHLTGKNVYLALGEYFRLMGRGTMSNSAFSQAFGLEIDRFLVDFKDWYGQALSRSAEIEVVPGGGVPNDAGEHVRLGVDQTRSFFLGQWGEPLRSSLRILLVPDKTAFAATLVREFGAGPAEAEKTARSATWRYDGGTAVLEVGTVGTAPVRVYQTALILTHKYRDERVSPALAGGITWLRHGVADAVAAAVARYREGWRQTLRGAKAVPDLAVMKTPEGWREATAAGSAAAFRTAALATLALVERHGWGSLPQWFRETRRLNDAEQAFAQVFGQSADAYAAEFKNSVTAGFKP